MRQPFNGNFPTTQVFNDACCRASYAKFGMVGHNGIDYGLPCGTEVYAPFSGTISFINDPAGYGYALFINDGLKECVLGHLSAVAIKSGYINEGSFIARSGTTGNSSACHLHFGIRPIPYNRNNGFFGYVDPNNYLKQGEKTVTISEAEYNDLKQWKTTGLELTRDRDQNLYPMIEGLRASVGKLTAIAEERLSSITILQSEKTGLSSQLDDLKKRVSELEAKLATQSGDSTQLNSLGVLLQWLLKRLGLK